MSACLFSCVQLSVIIWTVAARFLCLWNFPGKNTGVGCHFFLQGMFLTKRSNPCLLSLLHWQVDFLPLKPQGKPNILCISFLLKPNSTFSYKCGLWTGRTGSNWELIKPGTSRALVQTCWLNKPSRWFWWKLWELLSPIHGVPINGRSCPRK